MHASVPFPDTFFSRPFYRFPFSYLLYLLFFHFLCSFTKKKTETVCARAQAAFLRLSGHSVKEIAKSLKKAERRVNNWSKRQAKEGTAVFFFLSFFLSFLISLTNFTRNLIETAKYQRDNSKRQISKKLQLNNNQS